MSDGSDIVERLHNWLKVNPQTCKEAADEIDRLRSEIHTVHAHLNHLRDMIDGERQQAEKLRAALRRLVNDSMYKDHPEASQMAMDALAIKERD